MSVHHHVTKLTKEAELEIYRGLRSIRFGSIEISIQDSRIVQVERKEKFRLDAGRSAAESGRKAA